MWYNLWYLQTNLLTHVRCSDGNGLENSISMIDIHELPAAMRDLLAGATWHDETFGFSGVQVFRIARPSEPVYYLKIATHPHRQELLAEQELLVWLQGRLPVPAVAAWHEDNERSYLLISEIPGIMSYNDAFKQNIPALIRLLAEGMRLIHRVDIQHCPFDQRLAARMEQARQRVEAGLVDEGDFDRQRQGMRAGEVFQMLIASQPSQEDLVFTHGDYCLPNVLIDPDRMHLNGFIDWGRAGIADRYQDIALATRSLTYNFGPGWEELLWQAYGLEQVDHAKIEFYKLLDEFF
jgi:aminoglycoside phosphotransferase